MNENNTFYCSFVSIHYIVCECGDSFDSEDALKEHLEKDRNLHLLKIQQKDVTVIHEYKCGTCEAIFSTEEECIQHQDLTHTDVIIADHEQYEIIDNETDKEDGELCREEEEEDDPIKQEVPDCEEYAVIKDQYSNPPMRVQSIPVKIKEEREDDMPKYIMAETVTIDNKIYTFIPRDDYLRGIPRTQYLTRNLQLTNRVPLPIKLESVDLDEVVSERKKRKQPYKYKNIICEVCGKKYASNAALRYHQRVHTGVRPYPCSYCPKRFTMPLFQQIHMRIHTGEKPYMCQQCPKAFTNKAALLRHDRVHTGEKPYMCPKCGKAFSQSNSMKLHVHTVHLKLPAPYKSKRRRLNEMERNAQVFQKNQGVYRTQHGNDKNVLQEADPPMIVKSEDTGSDSEVVYCVEVAVGE